MLPILPNIMAVTGPMGIKEMEALASQRVLSSVLTLELPRQLHSVSLEKDPKHVSALFSSPPALPFVQLAVP